jgi:rRNA-processing protein FCF1
MSDINSESELFDQIWLTIDDTAKSRKVEALVKRYVHQQLEPKTTLISTDVNKAVDEIMEDCAVGHNFDYAGKAIKQLVEAKVAEARVETKLESLQKLLIMNGLWVSSTAEDDWLKKEISRLKLELAHLTSTGKKKPDVTS